MLCLSGFELYFRWVPLKINVKVTVKAKPLSCWIFENVPNENCSLD